MLSLIDELRASEERTRQVVLGTPEFVEIARETEVAARLVFRWAQMQLELAQSSSPLDAATEPVRLVNVVPRPIDRILANWREAQLRLEIAHPGSPEAEAAASDIERLREEYQAAHEVRLTEQSD